MSQVLGWTFIAWAALRWPNGAPAFLAVIAAFLLLRVLIPSLKQLWDVPPKPDVRRPGGSRRQRLWPRCSPSCCSAAR